jgi:hypothetical protein
MIELELHDDTPAGPDEKHGPGGPTHCGTARVDYEYQAEMWVQDVEMIPDVVVRIVAKSLGREWRRSSNGKFVETQ